MIEVFFTFYSSPGHNSFTKSEDGTEDLMIYHCRNYTEIKGDPLFDPNRHARVGVVKWTADGPDFGVPATDGDLLTGLHGVEPFGYAAAFFNGKLHIFLQRGTGRDGEQRLADARNGEHGALAGDMDEGLFAVKADDAEGLDVRRVDADIRDDGDIGDQRIVSHACSSPSVLMTLTMFIWMGHLARHRPQPTQPKHPSLLSGK